MPVVEKVHGGRVVVRDIGEFVLDDRADVDADTAAYLCDERGDFERVADEGGDDSHENSLDVSGEVTIDADAGSEADTADDDPSGDYPAADGTSDAHWRSIVTAVGDGVYDDNLNTVAEHDHRSSVQDAVGERRAELEG